MNMAPVSFNSDETTVVYVLGGPGAGKGTQCAKLVKEYGFTHLSAGDLLRAEQDREGSEYGDLIRKNIKDGTIVPQEVTIALLAKAMKEAKSQRFLIDGFPRKMDQALKFDEEVCLSTAVLFITVPEDVLLERLLERGKTSGRDDDNEESIKKRFKTFLDTSMPVVEHYRKQKKVIEVDGSNSVDVVYNSIKTALDSYLQQKPSSTSSTSKRQEQQQASA